MPIVQTKLFPPHTADSLRRDALYGQMEHGLRAGSCLTLVAAPAGFGKTTLVNTWLVHHPRPAAWIALDAQDNDLPHFLLYLAHAVQRLLAHPAGHSSDGLLFVDTAATEQLLALPSDLPTDAALEAVVVPLLNQAAQATQPDERRCLVLDDFHVIRSQAVEQTVAFLLDRAPPALHLVLISRTDPNLPLSRLRARGQLTELRAGHLRFERAEVVRFFEQIVGVPLTSAQVERLVARTEGWAAGLQLAGLSLRDGRDPDDFIRSFAGSNRYIMDYLVDEVLSQQSPAVQDFLLRTSLLDRLCGPLCDALLSEDRPSDHKVTPSHSGQQMLEQLERANLFLMPLDDERRWYRYHHLFADLLRHRLQQRLHNGQPDLVSTLHRRASAWYAKAADDATGAATNRFVADALRHALAAEDEGQVVNLLAAHTVPGFNSGHLHSVRTWYALVPDALIRQHPLLAMRKAWLLYFQADIEAMLNYVAVSEQRILEKATAAQTIHDADLLGEALSLRAWAAHVRGRPDEAVELAETARATASAGYTMLQGQASLFLAVALLELGKTARAAEVLKQCIPLAQASGNTFGAASAVGLLARLHAMQGDLSTARRVLLDALRHIEAEGTAHLPGNTDIFVDLASVYYEQNELNKAAALLEGPLKAAQQSLYFSPVAVRLLLVTAMIERAQNRVDAALRLAQQAGEAMQSWRATATGRHCYLLQIRFWLLAGDVARAQRWLDAVGLAEESPTTDPDGLLTIAYVALASGDIERAQRLAEHIDREASGASTPRRSALLRARLLLAQIWQLRGQPSRAMATLREAVTLAEAGGFVRALMDSGPSLAPLLERLPSTPFQQNLLKAVHAHQQAGAELNSPFQPTPSPDSSLADALIEPLTAREREVLALLASGQTNRQIAEQLIIAPGTVKRHAATIYAKLGVANRTEAASRARTLGLVG